MATNEDLNIITLSSPVPISFDMKALKVAALNQVCFKSFHFGQRIILELISSVLHDPHDSIQTVIHFGRDLLKLAY